MGHYRSEMGFEAEDEKRHKQKLERLAELEAKSQSFIDKHGVARLIAELIYDASESQVFLNIPADRTE